MIPTSPSLSYGTGPNERAVFAKLFGISAGVISLILPYILQDNQRNHFQWLLAGGVLLVLFFSRTTPKEISRPSRLVTAIDCLLPRLWEHLQVPNVDWKTPKLLPALLAWQSKEDQSCLLWLLGQWHLLYLQYWRSQDPEISWHCNATFIESQRRWIHGATSVESFQNPIMRQFTIFSWLPWSVLKITSIERFSLVFKLKCSNGNGLFSITVQNNPFIWFYLKEKNSGKRFFKMFPQLLEHFAWRFLLRGIAMTSNTDNWVRHIRLLCIKGRQFFRYAFYYLYGKIACMIFCAFSLAVFFWNNCSWLD